MAFETLLAKGKRLALRLVAKEIDRILAKSDRPKGVSAEATEQGVVLKGRKLKRRAITDPSIRNAAR